MGHFVIEWKTLGSHAPDRLVATHHSSLAAFHQRYCDHQTKQCQTRMRDVGRLPKARRFFDVSGGGV
jgi:hypothetical protein